MGELKQGSNPHIETVVWAKGKTFSFSFENETESETADLCQPKWNENQTVFATAIHTLDRDVDPLEGAAPGIWSLRIVEQSQCEGCCWLQRDGSRGCEGGDCGGKCLWRKATVESCIEGGAIPIAFLPQHTSISSWTTERLAHQTPDVLNYRVGPHPGYSFKCLACQSTE